MFSLIRRFNRYCIKGVQSKFIYFLSPGDEPSLDLSHLSEEERAIIQNVMAKSKDLDSQDPRGV